MRKIFTLAKIHSKKLRRGITEFFYIFIVLKILWLLIIKMEAIEKVTVTLHTGVEKEKPEIFVLYNRKPILGFLKMILSL